MDRLIYGECLITIINGGNMYTYALGIRQLVAHLIQLKRNNARASLHRSIVIGIVAELKMQISVHDRFIGFIDNQVQHMQLFRIIAVVYLVDDVDMVIRQPYVIHINVVVPDAVGLVGRHAIDVLGQDILNVLQLRIVLIAGQLLVQGSEVNKGTLVIYYLIVVYVGGVSRIQEASFVQLEIIILPFHDPDCAYRKEQVFTAIGFILQARLEAECCGQGAA